MSRVVVPESLLRLLIAIGEEENSAGAEAKRLLTLLKSFPELESLHSARWGRVCRPLADEQLLRLVRGLTLAEEALELPGGSVSAVIWTYKLIARRDPKRASELADWILSRTSNPWVPFGTNNHGASSLAQYQDRSRRRAEAIQAGLRRARAAPRLAAEARAERARQRQRSADACRSGEREEFLLRLAELPVEEQLRIMGSERAHSATFYPKSLAYAANDAVLQSLGRELRLRLLNKLKGKHRGPWGAFKKRLRATFNEELGSSGMPWDDKSW